MNQKFGARIISFLVTVTIGVTAHGGGLTTPQNISLSLPAANIASNGVPGATNLTGSFFMLSAVAPASAQGGAVSLVNTNVWVQRYTAGINGAGSPYNQANQVVVDSAGRVIVTGFSDLSPYGFGYATLSYANDGTPLWTNRFNDPAPAQAFATSLAVDGSNNVTVAGNATIGTNGSDVVTVRYAANGTPLWTNRYNSADANVDQLSGLAVNPAGDTFLALGTFINNGPPSNYVTLRYAPSGNPVWTNFYAGSTNGVDSTGAIAADANGNIFVTGGSDGDGSGLNMATLKYSPAGVPLWTNRFQFGVVDQGRAILADRSGNVVVAGESITISATYPIIEYATDGAPRWTNFLAGPNYSGGNVPLLGADPAGDIYVVGGSPGANQGGDYSVLKLSSAGVPQWTNRFTGLNATNGSITALAVDPAGNLFLTGYWFSSVNSNNDYVTVKYSPAGIAVWTNEYNGPSNLDDLALSVAVDGRGSAFVTGRTGTSGGSGGGYDYATVAYADYLLYTPPTNFIGTDTVTFTVTDNLGNSATGTVTVVVGPTGLRFNLSPSALSLGTNGFHIEVDGATGTNAVILLASTNLSSWQPILTNPAVGGTVLFTDPAAPALPRRYYRASQGQ